MFVERPHDRSSDESLVAIYLEFLLAAGIGTARDKIRELLAKSESVK